MKRLLLSLSSIAAVAAIVAVGSTGAWWSDTAESSDNTFNSGSMDLELKGCDDSGNNCGNWRNDVTETWDYENMYPGGDKEGSNLLLKNAGDTPADWLKFKTDVSSSDDDLSNVMRITEFSYAGESLLEDGAGADLGKYEGPEVEDCDVIVDGEGDNGEYEYIQNAIDNDAEDGDLICVRNGDYNESVEIDKDDITLATLNGADHVALNGGFAVNASGATVKGFEIKNGFNTGSNDLTGVKVGASNVAIESNYITNLTKSANRTVHGIHIYDAGVGVSIENNVIDGVEHTDDGHGAYGVLVQADSESVNIENNTIKNVKSTEDEAWAGAISASPSNSESVSGAPTDLIIRYNEIGNVEGSDAYPGVGFYTDFTSGEGVFADELTIEYNNFRGCPVDLENKDPYERDMVAENNWFGEDGVVLDEDDGDIEVVNALGGPHVGFVNGEDHNDNGFADLYDLHQETVVTEEPQLEEENYQELYLETQLDGPTATNDHQGENVNLDMEITMGQGPVNQ